MALHVETGLERIYRVVVPKVTSVGAAVVVTGALFKIMHWPGAGMMLTVGLLTEAFLFLLGGIQPAPPAEQHYHWELAYPALASGKPVAKIDEGTTGVAVLTHLDAMLKEANLSTDAFKKFGQGIQSLNDTAKNMKDLTNAVGATNEYSTNVKAASASLTSLNKAYSTTVSAMSEMANASKDAKDYHAQVQNITKNLGALNAVYEMEIKDADSHLKAMNKFYGNLTSAMQNMSDTMKDSELLKTQMAQLTTHLTSLNKVYGNMLTAMKG